MFIEFNSPAEFTHKFSQILAACFAHELKFKGEKFLVLLDNFDQQPRIQLPETCNFFSILKSKKLFAY